ncbi:MAG: hypothetical protein AAGG02_08370, partial [Cyanobacteria bacterium P01_H01_bin.15]
ESPWVVQDDARQFIFWMQRWQNPELFPNDAIADYFQTVSPAGFKFIYRLADWGGLQPLTFHKLLPIPLFLLTTFFCFQLTVALCPIPLSGFMGATLLNLHLGSVDTVYSATPRAFAPLLSVAFLYFWVRQSWLCWLTVLIAGLIYPQTLLLFLGLAIAELIDFKKGRIQLISDPLRLRIHGVTAGLSLSLILFFALSISEHGPTLTAAQGQTLPELLDGGRNQFFSQSIIDYWLFSTRSGYFPRSLLTPLLLIFGFALPFFCCWPNRFSLVRSLQKLSLFPKLLIVSTFWFFLAHSYLFRLHLPSRYTHYSLPIALAVAAAVSLTIGLQSFPRRYRRGLIAGTLVVIAFYPLLQSGFPVTKYKTAPQPELYAFFQTLPTDSLIATTSSNADYLPMFAQRSVLASAETAIPYHWGYYQPLRTHIKRLLVAQYTPDASQLQQFLNDYDVDYWLLSPDTLILETLRKDRWLRQYQPEYDLAITNLKAGRIPALESYLDRCLVWQSDQTYLLSADCIRAESSESVSSLVSDN